MLGKRNCLKGIALAVILFGLIGSVAAVSVRKYYNIGGYCLVRNEYVSNEQMIQQAITFLYKENYVRGFQPGSSIVPFESIDAFLAQNPECCKVAWGGSAAGASGSLIDAITGAGLVAVTVNYHGQFKNSGNVLKNFQASLEGQFNSCGGMTKGWFSNSLVIEN